LPVVQADLGQCQGYANCVVAVDDLFDIGDDGVVVLLRANIPDADLARVQAAVRACPVSALTVGDE
jgi:ferredoxin